jgi:hypothetical protein
LPIATTVTPPYGKTYAPPDFDANTSSISFADANSLAGTDTCADALSVTANTPAYTIPNLASLQ